MCKNNIDDFCGLLVVGLSKAIIAKMDGFKNLPMSTKVFNFARALKVYNKKSFDFVSTNLVGPCAHTMQIRNDVGHDSSFDDYNLKFIKNKILKIIEIRSTHETDCFSLSIFIDGTKMQRGLQC